jgi:hypothetical protein
MTLGHWASTETTQGTSTLKERLPLAADESLTNEYRVELAPSASENIISISVQQQLTRRNRWSEVYNTTVTEKCSRDAWVPDVAELVVTLGVGYLADLVLCTSIVHTPHGNWLLPGQRHWDSYKRVTQKEVTGPDEAAWKPVAVPLLVQFEDIGNVTIRSDKMGNAVLRLDRSHLKNAVLLQDTVIAVRPAVEGAAGEGRVVLQPEEMKRLVGLASE